MYRILLWALSKASEEINRNSRTAEQLLSTRSN
jgi:hypothetical protein